MPNVSIDFPSDQSLQKVSCNNPLGQHEEHKFFSGHGADVMVQIHYLDAGDLPDHLPSPEGHVWSASGSTTQGVTWSVAVGRSK